MVMFRWKKRDNKAVFQALLEKMPTDSEVKCCFLTLKKHYGGELESVLPGVEKGSCVFHWVNAVLTKVVLLGVQVASRQGNQKLSSAES